MELKITGTLEEVAGFIAATRESPFAGTGKTKTVVLEVNGHELGRVVVPAVQPKEEIVSPVETMKKAFEEALDDLAQRIDDALSEDDEPEPEPQD